MNQPLVNISHTSYSFNSNDAEKCTLKDIDLTVNAGELLMVVGSVGSGKSTLLNAMLDELQAYAVTNPSSVDSHQGLGLGLGLVASNASACHGSIAYCAQKPWIVASTVKSNIVLAGQTHDGFVDKQSVDDPWESDLMKPDGFKYPLHLDLALYSLAIASSRIEEDMKQWQHGELTEIGERGISVSGGQKARIALARAIYADADIYLLDDVLSAVDAHVGRSIFFDCIVKTLKDRGKAVVLATHQVQYLKYATKILVLSNDGHQAFYGSYDELRARGAEFSWVGLGPRMRGASLEEHEHELDEIAAENDARGNEAEDDINLADTPTPHTTEDISSNEINLQEIVDSKVHAENELEAGKSVATIPVSTLLNHEAPDGKKPSRLTLDRSLSVKQKGGVQEEKSAQGDVSNKLWFNYLSSGGVWQGALVLVSMMLSQGALMMSDYWLKCKFYCNTI